MRILLYEFIHVGGWRACGWDPPAESLRREGAAMLAAVADDFRRIDGVEVIIATTSPAPGATPKQGATGELGAPGGLPASAHSTHQPDWTLIIAPETDGILHECCRQVEQLCGALLGPSTDFVRQTSDKQATAERLAAAGVPVPGGCLLPGGARLPRDFDYPAVLKPVDGAGSQDTWLVDGPAAPCGNPALAHNRVPRRLERFCPGLSASVAFLCGADQPVALLPCRQRLSVDGRFRYQGGSAPLDESLAARAVRLGDRALRALPRCRGYVGVDLILGDDPAGRDDYVIEINPRLTTSYVGLRALCRDNLAQAMMQAAQGDVPKLSWRTGRVEFDADGSTYLEEPV